MPMYVTRWGVDDQHSCSNSDLSYISIAKFSTYQDYVPKQID